MYYTKHTNAKSAKTSQASLLNVNIVRQSIAKTVHSLTKINDGQQLVFWNKNVSNAIINFSMKNKSVKYVSLKV